MDIVPRIIPAHEWDVIEAGLIQRVDALNRFLEDLYVGGQEIIGDEIVPGWLVESADGYLREAHGIPATKGARCVVAGIDLVRDAEGTYRVLEDNLRVPSGVLLRAGEPVGDEAGAPHRLRPPRGSPA